MLIYDFLFIFVSSLSFFGSETLGLLEWIKKLSHLLSSWEGFEKRYQFVFGRLPISVSWTSSVRKEEFLLMQFLKMTKGNSGRKGFIPAAPLHSPSLREEKTRAQGRSPESGTDAEGMEKRFLLACPHAPLSTASQGVAPLTMHLRLAHQPIWQSHFLS